MIFYIISEIIFLSNMALVTARWNIDQPLWDQSTYLGRFKHFSWVTDPRLVFYPTHKLMNARELVLAYKYRSRVFLVVALLIFNLKVIYTLQSNILLRIYWTGSEKSLLALRAVSYMKRSVYPRARFIQIAES